MERRILLEGMDKSGEIRDRELSISIECDTIFPVILYTISSDILESRLERRTISSIDTVAEKMLEIREFLTNNSFRTIGRAIVHENNLAVTRLIDTRDRLTDPRCFVIARDDDHDVFFIDFHGKYDW